jgi:3-oxoacyl-[acyl-carrier protein] reductase
MTMGRLEGRVALVTGAASGFGAEIARQYAAEGAHVVLADINREGAQAVAETLADTPGGVGLAVACDVTSRPQIDAACTSW